MKIEARFDANYGHVLVKDGKEAFCPYQQPIPTQGIGGMALMRMPCSTLCPKAKIKEEFTTGHKFYVVGCASNGDSGDFEYKLSQEDIGS